MSSPFWSATRLAIFATGVLSGFLFIRLANSKNTSQKPKASPTTTGSTLSSSTTSTSDPPHHSSSSTRRLSIAPSLPVLDENADPRLPPSILFTNPTDSISASGHLPNPPPTSRRNSNGSEGSSAFLSSRPALVVSTNQGLNQDLTTAPYFDANANPDTEHLASIESHLPPVQFHSVLDSDPSLDPEVNSSQDFALNSTTSNVDSSRSNTESRGIVGQESKNLLQLLYSIAEDQARKEGYIHRSITCNHCGVSPVRGYRFKCANCVDFDICEICESMDVHIKTHVFVKIRIPIPPLANVRSSLFLPFYPGTEFSADQYQRNFISLQKETHFDGIELEALFEQYRSLSTIDSPEGGIDKDTYFKCLGPLGFEKNLIAERIFAFFDQDRDGIISFKELVCGLSILCKGNLDERIHYAFQGYDLDGDGFVSRDELRRMFKAYFNMSMAIVRDVVKTMEEGMMRSFDDQAAKPVSASFSAPIQSSGGPESSDEEDDQGNESIASDADDGFWPRQNTVMTNGIRRSNRPRAAGPRRTKLSKAVEQYDEESQSPTSPQAQLLLRPLTAANTESQFTEPNSILGFVVDRAITATNGSLLVAAAVSSSPALATLLPQHSQLQSISETSESPSSVLLPVPVANQSPVSVTAAATLTNTGIMRRTSQPILRNSLTTEEVNADTAPVPTRDSVQQIRQRTYQNRRSVSFDVQNNVSGVALASSSAEGSNATSTNVSPSTALPLPTALTTGSLLVGTSVPSPLIPMSANLSAVAAASATSAHSPALHSMHTSSTGSPTLHSTTVSPALMQAHLPQSSHENSTSVQTITSTEGTPQQERFPIMEAMSQDAIEEMVERTFEAIGAGDRDVLNFEEFRYVVEHDINMLAWFEALGSVF
ncbi:hypothetical protein BDV3_005765 [Batrachochytrium dendrobatidis]